jgi:hypothetical protein
MTTPVTRGPAATEQPPGPFAEGELAPGLFSPRLALLATALYNPVILIGYLVYLYGPVSSCVVGPLCSFDQYPGIIQVPLLLASALVLWLVLALSLQRAIEAQGPRQPALLRALAALSDYRRIRDLLLLYGALLGAALILGLQRHAMTLPAFVLGGFTAFVCCFAALSGRRGHPATSATPPTLPAPPAPLSAPGGTGRRDTAPLGAVSAWPAEGAVDADDGEPSGEAQP